MNRRNGMRTQVVLAENTAPSSPSLLDSPPPSSPASLSASSTEASSPSIFVFPDGALPPTRPHCRKKCPSHIPRPPNAFILFRSHFIRSQHVSSNVESNHSTLSKIIGLTWKALGDEEKEVWYSRARKAEAEHKMKWPKYAFRPAHGGRRSKGDGSRIDGEAGLEAHMSLANGSLRGGNGNGNGRKRTREIEPTDETRCMKIAEFLSQGLRGKELDDAINQYDVHHVPPIVTRFEVPLTAEGYAGGMAASTPSPPSFLPQPGCQVASNEGQFSEPVSSEFVDHFFTRGAILSQSNIPHTGFDFLAGPAYPSPPINTGYDDTLAMPILRHVPSLNMLSPPPISTSPSSLSISPSRLSSVSSDSLEAYPATTDGCYSSQLLTRNTFGYPYVTTRTLSIATVSPMTFSPPILHSDMWQTSFSMPGLASPTQNAGGYVCDAVSGLEYLRFGLGWHGQDGLGEGCGGVPLCGGVRNAPDSRCQLY